MKPVRLEFESGPRPIQRQLGGRSGAAATWLGTTAALAALALLMAGTWQLAQTERQTAAVIEATQQAAHLTPGPQRTNPPTALDAEQRKTWSRIVRQLNTPWPALLAALEGATPAGIALVSIEPDARQASIRLQAEAKTLDALLRYAQDLKRVGLFEQVVPVKHETNDQDPTRPLRLTLNIQLSATAATAPEGDPS